MNTKDNFYVNAADICLSMDYWPPAANRIEINAEINRPVRTLDLDEYTKKVQDDMMKALKVAYNLELMSDRRKVLGDDRTSVIETIKESSGHELMERYEKWKSDEENKLKQEQIEAAKKLLREHGFEVTEA